MGKFSMIVGYFVTISSPVTAALHVVDLILKFPPLALWVLGTFGLSFHFLKTLVVRKT